MVLVFGFMEIVLMEIRIGHCTFHAMSRSLCHPNGFEIIFL